MDRIGGMADGYFLYWEDVDFSRRAQQVGGRLMVREDLTVKHSEGGTQRDPGQDRRFSDTYYFYNCRNRLVFAARNLPRGAAVRWVLSTPRESWRILMRGGRRQLLQSASPLRATITGSLAGLRIALGSLLRPGQRSELQPAVGALSEAYAGDFPITALMSFPATPPKGNPYRLLLEQGLRKAPGLTIKHFSWRTALTGDYDVFHVHWPEILLEGRSAIKTAARRLLFVLFMIRMRLRRTPIVRTMHNLELPKDIDPIEVALLRAMERQTALWVRLNTSTELPPNRPGVTVLHGHYRDWYGRYPRSPQVRGRVIFQGLVRRYKNVPALVEAFRDVRDPQASLHVLGNPSTAELESQIRTAAGDDPRISLQLGFVEEADLVAEITAAELVVLPYQEMHNSAAVLTALSLDRPVLVPDNEVNRKLAAEVGPGWIHTYAGPITAAAIEEALDAVHRGERDARPDLDGRDWDLGGLQHADAYRRAVRSMRRRPQR
jgi:glycosyltransferase involved in cell wall biosynthesis